MLNGRIIPLEEMAIDSLNYIDGERDYFEWKERKSRGITDGFEMILINVVIKTCVQKFCGFCCFLFLLY